LETIPHEYYCILPYRQSSLNEDLQSLADADIHDCANLIFHVKKDDIPNIEQLSKSIHTIPELQYARY